MLQQAGAGGAEQHLDVAELDCSSNRRSDPRCQGGRYRRPSVARPASPRRCRSREAPGFGTPAGRRSPSLERLAPSAPAPGQPVPAGGGSAPDVSAGAAAVIAASPSRRPATAAPAGEGRAWCSASPSSPQGSRATPPPPPPGRRRSPRHMLRPLRPTHDRAAARAGRRPGRRPRSRPSSSQPGLAADESPAPTAGQMGTDRCHHRQGHGPPPAVQRTATPPLPSEAISANTHTQGCKAKTARHQHGSSGLLIWPVSRAPPGARAQDDDGQTRCRRPHRLDARCIGAPAGRARQRRCHDEAEKVGAGTQRVGQHQAVAGMLAIMPSATAVAWREAPVGRSEARIVSAPSAVGTARQAERQPPADQVGHQRGRPPGRRSRRRPAT